MKNTLRMLTAFLFIISASSLFAQASVKFEQPVLVSSAGQSADVKLAGLLFKKIGVDAKIINMAKVDDLKGAKSLVLVPGFSSKGLGAAGISAEDELSRVKSLIASAKENKIPVILLHIGGKARRKGQSDNFIKMTADAAKYMIVVKQGNEDGMFDELSKSLKIPLELVEKIPDASTPLSKIYK